MQVEVKMRWIDRLEQAGISCVSCKIASANAAAGTSGMNRDINCKGEGSRLKD